MSLRLINPQPMETFPKSNDERVFVQEQNGRVRLTCSPFDMKWVRDDWAAHVHRDAIHVAWSHTATTEPVVVSRGYELPSVAWIPIDQLTTDVLADHRVDASRLIFLVGGFHQSRLCAGIDGQEWTIIDLGDVVPNLMVKFLHDDIHAALLALQDPDSGLIAYRISPKLTRTDQ